MLLALVLSMSVLPTAGVLAYIARSDLESALDDYHLSKASYAAQSALVLIEADLLNDGDGQVAWPDPHVLLDILITEVSNGWRITVTACSDRAVAQASGEVEDTRPESSEDD